ncbi:MAG: glycoside hydrolase family 88 protein [Clostridia bacterium]|nr:glycoside hydrolase family 88 protein [Clostridia bacterium]
MVTEKITLNNPERFSKPHTISHEKLVKAAEIACAKLEKMGRENSDNFPSNDWQGNNHAKYIYGINKDWTHGMYTGSFWLAYEITGEKIFREIAESHLYTYRKRIEEKINMDDHDVGFVFIPSCIAAYKLTGNEFAKKAALDAADYFYKYDYDHIGRYIIRCYKHHDVTRGYRTMMDSLMNAPLLFWSSLQNGNEDYFKAASDHVRKTERHLVRGDGSTYHHYQFVKETGEPVRGITLQGNSDESCWSRGHSWGVLGFPLAYGYNKEEYLVQLHKDVTYFMLNHLPEDLIPYWDYDFTSGDEPRDSSAGAIAVCGMHEMCKYLTDADEQKAVFESAGPQILESIIDNCTGKVDDVIGEDYDGLIYKVTGSKPHNMAVNTTSVYGDFFYLEALARYLKPDFKTYW